MPSEEPRSDDRAALAATLALGALIAQQVAGKAARDALFLTAYDVRQLPWAITAASILSSAAALVFSRLLVARSPARVVPAALSANALLLLGQWWLSLLAPALAAAVFYLHMAFFGPTLASAFWSLVNERFDPHAAKRAAGRIGTGGAVGATLGGVAALTAARVMAPSSLLLGMAALNVLALLALTGVGATPGAGRASQRPHMLAGVRVLRESAYLRTLALFVALGAAMETVLDYLLSAAAVAGGRRGGELLSFFALFHTSVGLLGLVVQATLARRSLHAIGLAGTVALQPALVAAAAVAGAIAPRLLTAVAARGSEGVLHHSLFRSAYELLYTPLPEHDKRSTKALVDVSFDKLGSAAGGLVSAAVLAALPAASGHLLFALVAAGALVSLAMCRRLHGGYVAALAESLRSGAVRLDREDVVDSTTLYTIDRATFTFEREALLRQMAAAGGAGADTMIVREDSVTRAVAELRSADPRAVRLALSRGEVLSPELAAHVIPLLTRTDVSLDALRVLRRAAPRVTGQLLDALLDPAQPLVLRRRIPRVLKDCATQRAADGLAQGLSDPAFDVRYECAAALARLSEKGPALALPHPLLRAAARRELDEQGALDPASENGQRLLDHLFHLLGPGLERRPLRIALWALPTESRLRGTALEYLENVLPAEVRAPLFAALGVLPAPPAARRSPEEIASELLAASPPREAENAAAAEE